MTARGFLMWYLGAVVFVGTAGAGTYQALQRLHAKPDAPVPIAAAETPTEPHAPAVAAATPAALTALPKLRPPLAAAMRPIPSDHKQALAAHTPSHRRTAVASAHRPPPAERTWAYPPPPPPGYGYYTYGARYPYPGYDPYYQRYGYYRSF